MSTKAATKATSTTTTAKARKKTGSPAAEAKKQQTAMKATALEFTPAQLAKRLSNIRMANDTTTTQVEEFRNMFEAAKLQASNQRVLLARNAYLLATHKDVATKRYPLFYGGAAKVIAGPEATAKEIEALRKWITGHANAGAALAAKDLVWNQGDPTEAERAIVEKSHDDGVRAESAKKNERVRNAANKGKGKEETKDDKDDEDTDTDANKEVPIPSAKAIVTALEEVKRNVERFLAEARFTDNQIEAIDDVLSAISAGLNPEEVPAEDA